LGEVVRRPFITGVAWLVSSVALTQPHCVTTTIP
jgi:hypothetical protein